MLSESTPLNTNSVRESVMAATTAPVAFIAYLVSGAPRAFNTLCTLPTTFVQLRLTKTRATVGMKTNANIALPTKAGRENL